MEVLVINSFNNARGRKSSHQDTERCNDAIKAKEVFVISETGEQLGVLSKQDALVRARNLGMDLVEVSPNASPPVCRIMDYGRHKYEQQKKKQETKKRQVIVQIKEIRMRPKTDEHDYQTKLRHILRFLQEGDRCRVSILFRGREIVHKERAEKILARVVEDTKEIGKLEQDPKIEGRSMSMLIAPLGKK
ncbi:MAG: translation initiation factor IF-3 [Desulfovibrionaceae bacterium]